MEFYLRRYSNYAACSITADNTTIDLGLIGRDQAQILLEEMKGAVEMLEWFMQVTEE